MIEEEIKEEPPVKKKKIEFYTLLNLQTKKLNEELEMKLPNEFKGCISNYNHKSANGSDWHFDENNYNY